MWYVHNNEVIVFMYDAQQQIDPEIVEAFFPQSYAQGNCHYEMHHAFDTNVPYSVKTGERIEEDDSRGETHFRVVQRQKLLAQLFPLKRNRRVVSITAFISPVYGAQLIINSNKDTKIRFTVSEQTLFRVMGLCSKPEKYLIGHQYNVGTNPGLVHDGATFNLFITHKARSKAG